MARSRKFSEPGARAEKIKWNKAGTRKWLMEYTVMEVKPKAGTRKKAKAATAAKPKRKTFKKKITRKKTKKSSS